MEKWKIIFEWISVLFGGITGLSAIFFIIARILGRNIIDEWFARKNKKYQAKLDTELTSYKSMLDSKLEILKISYGNVFSERISIYKEACLRMNKIENYYYKLAAFKKYDCKNHVNFEVPCHQECPHECIVNYDRLIYEMREYIMETNNWFQSNEFFFSLDQYKDFLNIGIECLNLMNKTLDIIQDLSLSTKEKAFKCFDIFAEFKIDKYIEAKRRLIQTFRQTLNIPLFSN